MPAASSRYAVNPLARLLRHETTAANNAEAEIGRARRAIKRDILELTRELDVGRSADAREAVYSAVQRRIAHLSKRLARVENAALQYAAREAVRDGSEKTGIEVRYSKERADEMIGVLAGKRGKMLAAVFTENMEAHVIDALRTATVSALRENAVAGGSEKELARALEERWLGAAKDGETFQFVDAGGHVWDTKTYVAMNVRTNSMRVYNDCLADTIGRATGGDLVRVSTGGDPDCRLCFPWEGRILSLTGKTKDFPTYEEARDAGLFHPNCVHTLEYVDELLDAEEIDLQRSHPIDAETASPEDMDENRYEIDQDRYRRQGLDAEAARLAVDRDNLEASIRAGLLREDARELVDGMTDAQVTALCKDGNPPAFEPTKQATRADPHAADEKWAHGSRGGTVHIGRGADLAHLLEVCGVADAQEAQAVWQPSSPLEVSTDAFMHEVGASHTDDALGIDGVNPNFAQGPEYRNNCQRCVPAYEARLRGYDVEALPSDGNNSGCRMWKDGLKDRSFCTGGKSFKRDFESKTASDPEGSRYLLRIRWRLSTRAHFFMARKTDGGMVYEDPQKPSRDASEFFNRASKAQHHNWYLRIDNREFTDAVKDCVKPS